MQIDPNTLLFTDIDEVTAAHMRLLAEDIVLQGTVPEIWPIWLEQWFAIGGFAEGSGLLILSTVLPSRIFLSLLRRQEGVS